MVVCLVPVAGAPTKPAEPEVAVGDERTHPARLGERKRLAIVALALPGVDGGR
jgi:hypothetical protein